MLLLNKQLPDSHNLFLFGDIHLGTVLFHANGFQQMVDTIHGSYRSCANNYAICMGDIIEAITVDDPRYSMETTQEPFPLVQIRDAVELLRPIAGRLLCCLEGNHERKLWKFGPIVSEICNDLGMDFGTYSTKLSIFDKNDKRQYKIFATHGRKSITSTADDPKRRFTNMKLILKRHLKFKSGDCAIMVKGHTHKLMVCRPEEELYLIDDGNKIKQKYISSSQAADYIHPDHRYYISTGSFMKLYENGVSGYAEIAEYDPIELGYAIIRVRDREIQGVDRIVL